MFRCTQNTFTALPLRTWFKLRPATNSALICVLHDVTSVLKHVSCKLSLYVSCLCFYKCFLKASGLILEWWWPARLIELCFIKCWKRTCIPSRCRDILYHPSVVMLIIWKRNNWIMAHSCLWMGRLCYLIYRNNPLLAISFFKIWI